MAAFPEVFAKMPESDAPFCGIRMRLLRRPTASAIFTEATDAASAPEYAHGAQWGIVVDGEMELTIGGATRTYQKGEEYTTLARVVHGAKLRPGTRVIDVFDDPDWYRPRT